MELDQVVLEQVMCWGKGIAGFTRGHAVDGLTCVQGYVGGVSDEGRRVQGIGVDDRCKLALYAKDLAWTFWMDDVFDERGKGNPVDLDSIIRATRGEPTTPEATGLYHLRRAYQEAAGDGIDYQLWVETAIAAVTAWFTEGRLTRGELGMTYSEYLENGVNSTAMPHVVTAACVVYGFELSPRLGDPRVRNLLRDLAISCRLHNDLVSIDKERREGCLANAGILLERFMSPQSSRRFVEEELSCYLRRIDAGIAALGEADPLSIMARIMPEAHTVLYTIPRPRYQADPSAADEPAKIASPTASQAI